LAAAVSPTLHDGVKQQAVADWIKGYTDCSSHPQNLVKANKALLLQLLHGLNAQL